MFRDLMALVGIFLGMGAVVALILALPVLVFFSNWEMSEDNVSGIVYNTTNNSVISGNTNFSIRASEDTFISEENRSSYCLPPNSQYIELVNEAARDKTIKIQVTSAKGFWFKMPWTCIDNITVERI